MALGGPSMDASKDIQYFSRSYKTNKLASKFNTNQERNLPI